ncbi:MAG: hypothetical protein KTR26_09660 [Flammeovirgaceae bacterium]|nr:hypothetical protein [Flammeovirgaceae bacterium]
MKIKFIFSILLLLLMVFGYLFHLEEVKLIADFEKERNGLNEDKELTPIEPIIVDINQKKIEKLLSNFSIQSNPNSDSSWYIHKKWEQSDQNMNNLKARVNENGQFSLVSQYYGNRRILHDRIFVKIGENVYDSSVVKIEVPINKSTMVEVWETIELTGEKDFSIAREISTQMDKPVYVRLWGKEGFEDIQLTKENKMAIQESLELAILLKS